MPYDVSSEISVAWHLDDGASTLSNFNVTVTQNWCAQVFKPDWATIAPGQTVISWWITGVSVRVGKLSGSTVGFQFQVRRCDATPKPTGSQADVVTLATGSVPVIATSSTQPAWSGPLAMSIGNGSGDGLFYPGQSAAIVFAPTGIGQAGYVGCQTNGTNQSPSDQQRWTSSNTGSTWTSTTSTNVDCIIEVFGKYNTYPGLVAPPLDSATTNTIASGAGSTSHNFAVTVGSNNDRCLWHCVAQKATSETNGVCTGVSRDGVDFMEILSTGLAVSGEYVKWFRQLMPTVGTADVVETYNGTGHEGASVALSYYDVNQTDPEGGVLTDFGSTTGDSAAYQPVPVLIGDTNLVGMAWSSVLGATTAAAQGGTLALGGSETGVTSAEGAVVGRANGDVITGWLISGSGYGGSFALGIIGILSTTGLRANFYPAPADVSQFPKPNMRPAASDRSDNPDDGA